MIHKISDPATLYVGDVWNVLILVLSESGSVTPSAVSAVLYANESTADILSTYSSGSTSYSGNNITTPLIGIGSGPTNILPGKYKYMVKLTYNGGIIDTFEQELEFLERKG